MNETLFWWGAVLVLGIIAVPYWKWHCKRYKAHCEAFSAYLGSLNSAWAEEHVGDTAARAAAKRRNALLFEYWQHHMPLFCIILPDVAGPEPSSPYPASIDDAIAMARDKGLPMREVLRDTLERNLPHIADAQAVVILALLFDLLAEENQGVLEAEA